MTNILNYILGGLLVLAVLVAAGLWFQNNSLEKTVLEQNVQMTTLSNQKDALQASNDNLVKSIENQNKSLERLNEIQKTLTDLFTGFNSSMSYTNKKITDIQNTISKEPVPATCKDTIQYLKDTRKEFK